MSVIVVRPAASAAAPSDSQQAATSSLTIEDEGVLIASGVNCINFVGDFVTAVTSSTPGKVDVFISQSFQFVDFEIPSGSIDGSNTVYTLANSPMPTSSLKVVKRGLVMMENDDYTVSGNTISFVTGSRPTPGSNLFCWYRY